MDLICPNNYGCFWQFRGEAFAPAKCYFLLEILQTIRQIAKNHLSLKPMKYKYFCLILAIISLCSCRSKNPLADEFIEKPYIDHTYSLTEKESDYKSLQARGFTPLGRSVNHPGPLTCYYYSFDPAKNPTKQYLEWCISPSIKKMNDEMLKNGDGTFPRVGLGLKTETSIKPFFEFVQKNFPDLGASFEHKNYDWQKNHIDELPGWNFVSFKTQLIKDVNFFALSYDKRPENIIKNDAKAFCHKNSVDGVLGLIFDMTHQEFYRLDQLFGTTPVKNGHIYNHGVLIINRLADQELQKYFKGKTESEKAVILHASDIKQFIKIARPDYNFTWRGHKFYGIKRPNYAWDILVTDAKNFD
jgi:hypothetical protein